MKGTVIAQKEVQDVLKGFVFAELYTDATPWKAANMALQKSRFKTAALPLYVTLGPDGEERSRLVGLSSTAEFLAFLKKGLNDTSRVEPNYESAMKEAKRQGKPAFLEFFGVTGLECVKMKGTVIAEKEVQDLLKGFVTAELHTDATAWKEANTAAMKDRFKSLALPLYVTMGPDGQERSRLSGMASKEQFVAFLKQGLQSSPK